MTEKWFTDFVDRELAYFASLDYLNIVPSVVQPKDERAKACIFCGTPTNFVVEGTGHRVCGMDNHHTLEVFLAKVEERKCQTAPRHSPAL